MNFAIKPGYDRPEEVKELFIEYTDMLVKGEPGFEEYLDGATLAETRVVTDGKVITAAGMGVALEFGLALVAALKGQDAADELRRAVLAD